MDARALVAALAAGLSLPAQETSGSVSWEADLAAAHEKSLATGRPVIAYFTFDT